MKQKSNPPKPNEFSKGVGRALQRTAQCARETARMRGTPIYVSKKGKVAALKPWW